MLNRKTECKSIVTLERPLDCKEIHLVHPKGHQSWVFIGRTDGEAETPILWPPDAKSWIIQKDPDAGKDWGQEEKGRAGGDGNNRGWDGCMASPTQWTWVWVHSGSWWWIGRPGVLRFMGSQRVGRDWATELNWIPYFVWLCWREILGIWKYSLVCLYCLLKWAVFDGVNISLKGGWSDGNFLITKEFKD